MSTDTLEHVQLDVDLDAAPGCESRIPLDWPLDEPWNGENKAQCPNEAEWVCSSECGCVRLRCDAHRERLLSAYVALKRLRPTFWYCESHAIRAASDPGKDRWTRL